MRAFLVGILISVVIGSSWAQSSIDHTGNPTSDRISVPFPVQHGTAAAKFPTIIKTFPSPNQSGSLDELAYDGQNLWVTGYNEYRIHLISGEDGNLLRSIPTTVQRPYGLAYDGHSLWVLDVDNLQILKLDPKDGEVLKSIPTPGDSRESFPGGLCWDGQHLWTGDRKGPEASYLGDSLFMIDTTGLVIKAYPAKGRFNTGLAYSGGHLWSTDNASRRIYRVDPRSYTNLDTLVAPGGAFPNGLTIGDEYLWVANNDKDSIYQVVLSGVVLSAEVHEPIATWKVFPNPSSGRFQFQRPASGTGQMVLRVFNAQGQLVHEQGTINSGQLIVDLTSLPKGIYHSEMLFGPGRRETVALILR